MEKFQHTAARRRLHRIDVGLHHGQSFNTQPPEGGCSTGKWSLANGRCFNTQPPEGGCIPIHGLSSIYGGFNTQPPEGGCFSFTSFITTSFLVSTHSRPKAAAVFKSILSWLGSSFQHTAARRRLQLLRQLAASAVMFQHTAARRRLQAEIEFLTGRKQFQHTAARRRLLLHH